MTLLVAFVETCLFVLSFFWWIVVLSALFSWLYAFNVINARSKVVVMIDRTFSGLTEPLFLPVRRLMPDLGGVDLAPLVILVIIYFLQRFLVSFL